MPAKGIAVCVCVVALACAVSGRGAATEIFFDLDGDLAADTEWTLLVGEQLVVPVYLSGFGETTGSFQFDILYDGDVLALIDYDTYVGQPDEDPGLSGPIQTLAELGPWATLQWSEPVTQELNQLGGGGGGARLEFYTAGSLTQTAGGDGILAYLVFDAVALGRTTLQLQAPGGTWFLEDVDDQPAPTNLTITVIPEPALALLALAGFACVLARRRALA
jgi:hypothetical protein